MSVAMLMSLIVPQRLQTRLKRLKRGHLVEDANAAGTGSSHRRVSVNSGSPSTPSYSIIPPPAKRHQTSHPAHTETPPSTYPTQPPAHQPSYHFHPPPPPPPPAHHVPTPYHSGPPYQSPSYRPSPPIPSHSRVPSGPIEVPPNTSNGSMQSPPVPAPTSISASTSTPKAAPAPLPPLPASQTPTGPHSLPPRQSSATYDTRPPPPPPHPSSFPAINHPPTTGFAAINSNHAVSHTPLQTPSIKEEQSRPNARPVEQTPVRTSSAEEKSATGGSAANKRTPSTTHPYQMSEAFANRHHHCERTDSLNRGIWTYFGLHGSKDHPTIQPVEMYLVCDHDGCRRIDWRTVHGLQCHIVKNHDQPKGTIGSLEKALDRYGVPVREIEEHERQHGPGSGGTMADPKNAKVRTKAKDFLDRRDLSEREGSASAPGGLHLQKHPSYGSDSPHMAHVSSNLSGRKRSHSFDEHAPESGSESTPASMNKLPPVRAVSGFQAVNASWQGASASPSERVRHKEWPPSQAATSNKVPSPHVSQAPPTTGTPTPFWQSWPGKPTETTADRPLPASYVVPSQRQTPVGVSNIHALQNPTPPPSTPTPVLNNTARPGDAPSESRSIEQRTAGHDSQKQSGESKPEMTSVPIKPSPEAMTEVRTTTPKVEAEDIMMTDAPAKPSEEMRSKAQHLNSTGPKPVGSAESETFEPQKPKNDDSNGRVDFGQGRRPENEMQSDRDDRAEVKGDGMADRAPRTPTRETTIERSERKETRSPEMSHKRSGIPRRESRRSSMAATSAKAIMEQVGEDDIETNYTANTASKAESVDDDSDSITVNLVPNPDRQRDRDRESDRTKTPIRLPNGRFSRTTRRRG